jgi:hypothetical protein
MSVNDPSSIERRIGARYQVLLILWTAQLMALAAFFMLAVFVFRESSANNPMLFWILAASGLLLVAVSFAIKQKLFAQAVEKQSLALVQQGQIVAIALCEAAGLFGLLARAITGSPYFYLLFAVATLGILLHFPRREPLMAAAFKGRI